MKIDEELVKVSAGYITIEDHLEVGEDVAIMVKGTISKDEHKDNQDGTVNRIVTVKGRIASSIYPKEGEVITVTNDETIF